jgi:hypothetical protein
MTARPNAAAVAANKPRRTDENFLIMTFSPPDPFAFRAGKAKIYVSVLRYYERRHDAAGKRARLQFRVSARNA